MQCSSLRHQRRDTHARAPVKNAPTRHSSAAFMFLVLVHVAPSSAPRYIPTARMHLVILIPFSLPHSFPRLPSPQDDVAIIWLNDSSQAAAAAAALQANAATIGAKRIIHGNDLVRNKVLV